ARGRPAGPSVETLPGPARAGGPDPRVVSLPPGQLEGRGWNGPAWHARRRRWGRRGGVVGKAQDGGDGVEAMGNEEPGEAEDDNQRQADGEALDVPAQLAGSAPADRRSAPALREGDL